MREITLDAYKAMVGQEIGVSRWFEVNQDRIDQFADVTEDHLTPSPASAIARWS